MDKYKWMKVLVVGLLVMSLYFNYQQRQELKTIEKNSNHNIVSMYFKAAIEVNRIVDEGYKALATSDADKLQEYLKNVQNLQKIVWKKTLNPFYFGFVINNDVTNVYAGLQYANNQVIENIMAEGWNQENRKDLHKHLADYKQFAKYFDSFRELDLSKNFSEGRKAIEDQIVAEFIEYKNYEYASLNIYEGNEISEDEWRRKEDEQQRMIDDLEQQAHEIAIGYVEILFPEDIEIRHSNLGITSTGYTSRAPHHEAVVTFRKEEVEKGIDALIHVKVTSDPEVHEIYTEYVERRSNNSRIDNRKRTVGQLNFIPQQTIEITSNKIVDLVETIEEVKLESYVVEDGRLYVSYNLVIDDVVVNRNYYAAITLDNGWIETLRPTRHDEGLEVYKSAINALDVSKVLAHDNVLKELEPNNEIIDEGHLYFTYLQNESKLTWRFRVQTGHRHQWIHIDAYTGEEVDVIPIDLESLKYR